jgi:hypothetical protein
VGGSKPGTFVSTGNRLLDKLEMDKVRGRMVLLCSARAWPLEHCADAGHLLLLSRVLPMLARSCAQRASCPHHHQQQQQAQLRTRRRSRRSRPSRVRPEACATDGGWLACVGMSQVCLALQSHQAPARRTPACIIIG